MRIKHLLPAAGVAFLLSFVIACQTTPVSQSSSPHAAKAVVVTPPNGGPSTVYFPSDDGKSAYALVGEGGHECADCKEAAAKYFQGGPLEMKCPSCGGMRQAVTFPTIGHN